MNPLPIGTKTQYGIITAVGYVGERYYWLDDNGVTSMMPATTIESSPTDK
jgi:hypothetical protein